MEYQPQSLHRVGENSFDDDSQSGKALKRVTIGRESGSRSQCAWTPTGVYAECE